MQHLRSCLYKPRVFHGIKSLDGVIISNQQSFGNKQTINWDDTSGKKCFCYENKVFNRKNWQHTRQVLQLLIRYGTPPAGAWGKICMGSDKEERESFGIAAFIDDTDGTGDLKLFFPANQMVCCFSCFFFFPQTICIWNLLAHTRKNHNNKNKRYPAQNHLTSRTSFCKEEGEGWRKRSSRWTLRRPSCAAGNISQAVPIYLHLPLFAARFFFVGVMKIGKSLRAEGAAVRCASSRWQHEHAERTPCLPVPPESAATPNGFNICLSYLESEKYRRQLEGNAILQCK